MTYADFGSLTSAEEEALNDEQRLLLAELRLRGLVGTYIWWFFYWTTSHPSQLDIAYYNLLNIREEHRVLANEILTIMNVTEEELRVLAQAVRDTR